MHRDCVSTCMVHGSGLLTECGEEPVNETERSPIDVVGMMMNVVVVLLREHVDEEQKGCVGEGQYREINVRGAFDAGPGGRSRKDKGYRRRCCSINHRVYCRPREYHIVYEIAERTNHQGLRNEIVDGKVSPRL